ncbi:RluA family pseudouridine synthase [Enterococcus cecorum]|uniref:RluA family pseudouridine synthase n=1 Tax=Enterococcus cecorum TaxID=44008 RepID=UPI00200AD0D3|nr:RluA family pseudouridine synthase [Enterococcus cecorum]
MQYAIQLPIDFTPCTIREVLEEQWLVPRKVRHFLRVRKNVLLNGEVAMFHQVVQPLDTLTLIIEEEDYQYQKVQLGQAQNVTVLYEDEHMIVVDKKVGIKTHPNQPNENGTLQNDVAAYLAQQGEGAFPHVVHRLDKETSGLVLFAKNPFVLPILGRLLEQKEIFRKYQAIVEGRLDKDLNIRKKIGRHRHDRRKRTIDERNGQEAITHVQVHQASKKQSQIYCILETGRTHQIRVHLASIQHPIVGDPLYNEHSRAKRLMLHAYQMHLIHPFTKEKLMITSKEKLF